MNLKLARKHIQSCLALRTTTTRLMYNDFEHNMFMFVIFWFNLWESPSDREQPVDIIG